MCMSVLLEFLNVSGQELFRKKSKLIKKKKKSVKRLCLSLGMNSTEFKKQENN